MSLTKHVFIEQVESARTKYTEFEDKIKDVEMKVNGKISKDYDLDVDRLYDQFVA